MIRLRPIDDTILPSHCYLTKDDACQYLLDYDPHRYDAVKRIIMAFKKPPGVNPNADLIYKAMAIWRIAALLANAKPLFYRSDAILVPIPPSKTKNDPMHDDRMLRLLRLFRKCQPPADVREMILAKSNATPSHDLTRRPGPDKILRTLLLDRSLCESPIPRIILVDDILTSGAHFKACKRLLQGAFPNTPVSGVFVARRVLPREAAR